MINPVSRRSSSQKPINGGLGVDFQDLYIRIIAFYISK